MKDVEYRIMIDYYRLNNYYSDSDFPGTTTDVSIGRRFNSFQVMISLRRNTNLPTPLGSITIK